MKYETRNFELRTDTSAPRRLKGYAAVFNSDSEDMGFIETLAPGCFTEALRTSDCRALLNHDSGVVLGRQSAGTLRLQEDSRGLRFELNLPDTQAGRDTWESVRRGDIREMSFSFSIAPGGDVWNRDRTRRTVTRVAELRDIAPVTFAAYQATNVEARQRPGKFDSETYEKPHRTGSNETGRGLSGDYLARPMMPGCSPDTEARNTPNTHSVVETMSYGTELQSDMDLFEKHYDYKPFLDDENFIAFRKAVRAPRGEAIKPDPNSHSRSVQVIQDEADQPFESLGEMLVSVRSAARQGGRYDPRLASRASGMNEGLGSDGGFLVQTDQSSKLLETVWGDGSPILSAIDKTPISGNANSLSRPGLDETSRANGSRAGGVFSYWKGEAEPATASKPKFRTLDLKLNKLIGLCYATDEMLADVAALDAIISRAFEAEMRFRVLDAVINGTGAGQPLGIMNAGSLVTVAKESGQTADTIKYENVVKMWTRLLPGSAKSAVWCVNQDTLPQLMSMFVPLGTGGAQVYREDANGQGRIFGRPVEILEQCQTLGDKGDIILGDFSGYVAIDKGAVKKDFSLHVKFVEDEGAFRFTYRFDGQPVLASAITPKNGTNTLSHFVALAER